MIGCPVPAHSLTLLSIYYTIKLPLVLESEETPDKVLDGDLDFWSLPYEQRMSTPDSRIAQFEEVAQHVAPDEWQCQFVTGTELSFGFRTALQRNSFFLACGSC